jgi:hypothetical protein
MTQLVIKPDVRLYRNSALVAAGKAAYLGLLGIHVEHCDTTFPKYTSLELEIGQSAEYSGRQYRLPVVVTICSSEGMGLTFSCVDASLWDKWKTIASSFLLGTPQEVA